MKVLNGKEWAIFLVVMYVEKDASLNDNKWQSPSSLCDTLFHSQQQIWSHVNDPDVLHGTDGYAALWVYDSFTLMQTFTLSSMNDYLSAVIIITIIGIFK